MDGPVHPIDEGEVGAAEARGGSEPSAFAPPVGRHVAERASDDEPQSATDAVVVTEEAPQVSSDEETESGTTGEQAPQAHFAIRFLKLFADLITVRNVAILAGIVLVGVSGLTGGLGAAEDTEDGIPHLPAGHSAQANPFTVSVNELFWSDTVDDLYFSSPTSTYLIAKVDVESSFPEFVYVGTLQEAVTATLEGYTFDLPEGWGLGQAAPGTVGRAMVFRAIDNIQTRDIQPAMPQEYWMVWELPGDTPHVDAATMRFTSLTYRRSSMDRQMLWTDPVISALQTLSIAASGEVH